MKTIFRKFSTPALLLFILLGAGCKKVVDYLVVHPDGLISNYQIKKFIYRDPYSKNSPPDTITFTYNQYGNPVSGTRPGPRTGAPNYLFLYDKDRLTDFVGVYSNGTSAEYWHKYFYDNLGRIVLDSVYQFPQIQNGKMVNPYGSYIIRFDYDNLNRIIGGTMILPDGYTYPQSYSYDANGNRSGGSYDSKINFRRTNRIWMFLDRDYSINNSFLADTYNAIGLPTSINLNPDGGFQTAVFTENYFSEATIIYQLR